MTSIFDGPVVRSLYKQLVRDFGGVEAAAQFLDCSKGTISKEVNGQMHVATEHWGRLEDELGRYPITTLLNERRGREAASIEKMEVVRTVLKEIGEVPGAILNFVDSGDPAQAIKEATESVEALQSFLSQMQDAKRVVPIQVSRGSERA